MLAGLGRAVIPLHMAEQVKGLEIVSGLKPLRVPVYLAYYSQAFYTRLQKAVIDTVKTEVPAYLRG